MKSGKLVTFTALCAAAFLPGSGRTEIANKLVPGEGFVDVTAGKVRYRVVDDGPGTPLLVFHGGPGIPGYYLTPMAGTTDSPEYQYAVRWWVIS